MLSTKNLASRFDEVPKEWVWMYYCNLWNESFDGTSYKVHSLFNSEKTPSMTIYYKEDKGRYYFKDFSSGFSGDEVNLVQEVIKSKGNKKPTVFQASMHILSVYNSWMLNTGSKLDLKISSFKKQRSYKVEFKSRKWNELDKAYWQSYNIGSKLLNYYNIAALSEFTLISVNNEFTVKGEYIYGYFNNLGELIKIYQPKVLDRKFIWVKSYIQGSDQLRGGDVLIIQSGMKDILAFKTMRLNTDDVAPDSENTMIPVAMMKKYLSEYKFVLVMLDNDEAGHKAMMKYKEMYPEVRLVWQTLYKDVADTVKAKGVKKSRDYYVPLIDKVINRELCTQIELDKKYNREMLFGLMDG